MDVEKLRRASPAGDVVIQAGESVYFAGTASDTGGTVSNLWWYFPGGSLEASTNPSPGPIAFPSLGSVRRVADRSQ
jgi:hypothetical protein